MQILRVVSSLSGSGREGELAAYTGVGMRYGVSHGDKLSGGAR